MPTCNCDTVSLAGGEKSRTVALRHLPFYGTPLSAKIILRCGAIIQILPPCGMMSLKDLKEHHYTKQGGTPLMGFVGAGPL